MNTTELPALPASRHTKSQRMTYGPRFIDYHGEPATITADVRYDDECGNGHNTFAITGTIRARDKIKYRRDDNVIACGCCHEEIAKAFPELAPFIKWHLCGSDMPMHYVANTVYLAGDRDHWGLRKGEFRQHTSRGPYQANGIPGVPCWELCLPKAQPTEIYSHEKPAPVTLEWQPRGITGEGKARELNAARNAAVWPDATDEQLCAEPEELKAALLARLPARMQEFKSAVESLGFVY